MAADIVIEKLDKSKTRQFFNTRDCFRLIYLKDGWRGFYNGFFVS